MNNNLSSSSSNAEKHYYKSIPGAAILIVTILFVIGIGVSLFIFIEVHNAVFFIISVIISAIVAALLIWNALCFFRKKSLVFFLQSFPVSDLHLARHGQLVKITGAVWCGDVRLESSYEKVAKCVYTSTLLYEYQDFGFKSFSPIHLSFLWRLVYTQRLSTDFYISDKSSGVGVLVKAGCGCSRLTPLVDESRLVYTRKDRAPSPNLTKWLTDRSLSANNSRVLYLQEGYMKEGDCATVMGMLHKGPSGDVMATVVQPPELISTGCLWQRLLFPVDFNGLLLGLP